MIEFAAGLFVGCLFGMAVRRRRVPVETPEMRMHVEFGPSAADVERALLLSQMNDSRGEMIHDAHCRR